VRRRLQLVVNPAAGGGRGRRSTGPVTDALRADGHDVVVTTTRSLDHAEELVADAVADRRVVVALGGDGLVGRVAGAVADLDGLMAVLPAGRGNDLCRAVGLPPRAVEACTVLRTGRERALDLGVVMNAAGQVAFLRIASIGFDSEVQERVLRSRGRLGRLVYVGAALRTLARWEPARFCCSVDGVPLELTGWSVAVSSKRWAPCRRRSRSGRRRCACCCPEQWGPGACVLRVCRGWATQVADPRPAPEAHPPLGRVSGPRGYRSVCSGRTGAALAPPTAPPRPSRPRALVMSVGTNHTLLASPAARRGSSCWRW
jgi:hypothetical protein